MFYIKDFMGTRTIRFKNAIGEYKISEETIGFIIEHALDQGLLYSELLGKDRLETLIME